MSNRIVQSGREFGELYFPRICLVENELPLNNLEFDQEICAPCYEKKCFCLCSQGPAHGYHSQYQQNALLNNVYIFVVHEELLGLLRLPQMNNQINQEYNINLAVSPYYEYAFIKNMAVSKILSRMSAFTALAERHRICSGASHKPCGGDCIVSRYNKILRKLVQVFELLILHNPSSEAIIELISQYRIVEGHQWAEQQLIFLGTLINAAHQLERSQCLIIELIRLVVDTWDHIIDRVDTYCPLTSNRSYTVFRKGFFTPSNWNQYPSGCYVYATNNQIDTVNATANGIINVNDFPPELRATIIHEMTHAYMAMKRTQQSIYVCPWIEEGYATLFEHLYAGTNGAFLYSGCDGEAYAAAGKLSEMYRDNQQEFWNLLNEYLNPQTHLLPGHFCNRHQNPQTRNWITQLRS